MLDIINKMTSRCILGTNGYIPRQVLEESSAIGGGGLSIFGGKLRPTWGDDQYGFNWKIGLGG